MHSLRSSLLEARLEWNAKIDKLKESMVDIVRATRLGVPSGEAVVFEELLVLFTQTSSHPLPGVDLIAHHHDAIANIVRLHTSYPDAVEFYIPQLVVFLLYNAFETTTRLRYAMLGMCAESVSFAHRMHWFIEAFCLTGAGVDSEGVALLHELIQQIEEKGIFSAQRHASSRQVGDSPQLMSRYEQSMTRGYVSPDVPTTPYPSEQLAMSSTDTLSNVPVGTSYGTPPEPSPYLQFPSELCKTYPSGLNAFSVNLSFWLRLSDLSRDLCLIPREQRTEELKSRLPSISAEYLPSTTLYAPVGNTRHR